MLLITRGVWEFENWDTRYEWERITVAYRRDCFFLVIVFAGLHYVFFDSSDWK